MFAIEIVLIGAIAVGGIAWQIYLFDEDGYRDDPPLRVLVPLILGGVSILGLVIHGLIANLGDARSYYDWGDMFSNLWKVIVLFVAFTIKSFFGPIFTALTLIMVCYFLFEYGEFRVWKFVKAFFDWVFSMMPSWIETLYIVLLLIVGVGGSIVDGVVD